MFMWRQISTIGLLLVGLSPGAWAQSAVLNTGNSINLYGLTITVGTCTIAGATCSNGDGLLLEGVSTGRDTITFEVVNKIAGSAILSAGTRNVGLSTLNV